MTNIDNQSLSDSDDDQNEKKSLKGRSLNDITKELIDQLKDSPVELFMQLPIEDDEIIDTEPIKKDTISEHISNFNFKPKEIKKYLDRFIIGQSSAKALSIAICDHYNFIKEAITTDNPTHYTKQNILMIGPTGVGKTYMIKRAAELIVPFVKSDATKFTETGYQGGDVDDLVRQLYKKG